MSLDPKDYIEILTALIGLFSAVIFLWWRLSKGIGKFVASTEALGDAQKSTNEKLGKLADAYTNLGNSIVRLETKLEEREKDISRLEGALEVGRKDMINVITSLQQCTSSLDAMWRTLQGLFPDKVPARMSDRK